FQQSLLTDSQTNIFTNITENNIFDFDSDSYSNLIALTRKIIDLTTNQPTGLILVTVPVEKFLKLLTNDLPFNRQVISIYNSTGELIMTTNSDFKISKYSIDINNKSSEPLISYINEGIKYVNCENYIPDSNWILTNTIPKSEVFRVSSLYIIFFFINLIFFLIPTMILYLFFIKRIFNPIKSLVVNMDSNNLEKNLNSTI
ncbi:cache domain-containing protein, partial [Clostridium saudiense]|nr:cache domain-containing protein [Clostridium saudiense]